MSIAAHICGGHADLHTLSLEKRKTMTEEEAAPYIYVTQWFCAGVATYIVFIWSLKFNMLFFYQRVVDGLAVHKFIIPSLVLVSCTFISIIGILFASCRPYYRMWKQYPDQGGKATPQILSITNDHHKADINSELRATSGDLYAPCPYHEHLHRSLHYGYSCSSHSDRKDHHPAQNKSGHYFLSRLLRYDCCHSTSVYGAGRR